MAQIQYNKISLIQINKDLAIRRNALPVLQSKESALRAEARRIRMQIKKLEERIREKTAMLSSNMRMFGELPKLIELDRVTFAKKNIASINVLVVDQVLFKSEEFSLSANPAWFLPGIELIKETIILHAERINLGRILESIEYARRKTTQKVNLYEKVQIPFFEEAIRKIKRFLEDEDNLSKSSQKVLKRRMEAAVAI